MERFLIFLAFVFCAIQAADPMEVDPKKPELRIDRVELASGYYLYTISIQEGQQELGKVQFKFYDAIRRPKSSEINYIIIPEHVRNEGKGDLLLKAALDILKELRCSEVKASVDRDNGASKHLFEKNGFREDGSAKPHILGGETILMKKQL